MKDPALLPFFNKNKYASKVVQQNGICFNLNASHNIFGNWLSSSSSAISIEVTLCNDFDNVDCDEEYIQDFYDMDDARLHLGSFSSTVNNSDRDAPFVYDYYSHGSLHLSPQKASMVDIMYKKVRVLTDVGKIFEENVQNEVGIIDTVRFGFKDTFELNSEGDALLPKVIPLTRVTIRGSSRIDQYSRKYDKVFDFIGNFGGAMEFVFVSVTVLSIWLEELFKHQRLTASFKEQFGHEAFPRPSSKSPAKKGCCRKQPSAGDKFAEELVERSLSFEQLVKNTMMGDVLLESVVPPELLATAPYFLTLQLAQKTKLSQENKPTETRPISTKENLQHAETSNLEDQKIDLRQSLDKIMSPEFDRQNPDFTGFKKELLVLMSQETAGEAGSIPQSKFKPLDSIESPSAGNLDAGLVQNELEKLNRNKKPTNSNINA